MTEALNLYERTFVSDGTTYPVTAMYDGDGEVTQDPAAAVTFEAGADGRWIAARECDFAKVSVH